MISVLLYRKKIRNVYTNDKTRRRFRSIVCFDETHHSLVESQNTITYNITYGNAHPPFPSVYIFLSKNEITSVTISKNTFPRVKQFQAS